MRWDLGHRHGQFPVPRHKDLVRDGMHAGVERRAIFSQSRRFSSMILLCRWRVKSPSRSAKILTRRDRHAAALWS